MAEKLISPGVFTQENDLTFLPQGIAQIGAAIVGPTPKGPAFVPTLVESYNDYTARFGLPDGNSYVPYTVRNYLKHSGRATIVRTVGLNGYTTPAVLIKATAGPYSSVLVGVLVPTQSANTGSTWGAYLATSSIDKTRFVLTSSVMGIGYTCSIDPTRDEYIANVFGNVPANDTYLYVYDDFPTKAAEIARYCYTGSLTPTYTFTTVTTALNLTGSPALPPYSTPSTPWILSQMNTNLFKIHHFNAGPSDVYVSIENIKLSGEIGGVNRGAFTLLVRQIGDTDLKPVVLETYSNLNLDPTDPDYILKRIGDQYYWVAEDSNGQPKIYQGGDYTNKSKYIRIQMGDPYGENEVPIGFGTYYGALSGSQGYYLDHKVVQKDDDADIGAAATSSFNFKYYLGFDQSNEDNLFVLKPIPLVGSASIAGTGFKLTDGQMQSGSAASSVWSQTFILSASVAKSRKFSVALQGGYDGINPTVPKKMGSDITATNVMGFDCSYPVAEGTISYRKAIDLVSTPDEFDINMLVTPGITYELHPSVITYGIDMAEERGDTFYILDAAALTSTAAQTVTIVGELDSNYAATYYPWVKMYDSDNVKYLWVPPSTVMAAVLAYNDKVSAPWYAPAGLNRGGIAEATQVYERLTQADRDFLYEGRVNPIVTFINQGIVTWGQKTLQVRASALDRINVRRLLIELKKYIASATKYLVFEQNNVQTRTRFINIVTPYLDSVQQKQGLYTFKVVMDETNNTPDLIDRNIMMGTIWLQPTRVAEMIVIDFNITPTGATFGA